jgi:hypothetical protein
MVVLCHCSLAIIQEPPPYLAQESLSYMAMAGSYIVKLYINIWGLTQWRDCFSLCLHVALALYKVCILSTQMDVASSLNFKLSALNSQLLDSLSTPKNVFVMKNGVSTYRSFD